MRTWLKQLRHDHLRRFAYNRRGNVALTFVLATSALAVAGAGTVDYANMSSVRTTLQAVADAAATAAARELYLIRAQDAHIRAVAKAIADPQLDSKSSIVSYLVDARAEDNRSSVVATIEARPKVYFSTLVGLSDPKVRVTAKARILGSGRVCAVALDGKNPGAISLKEKARLTAEDCSIFSNSPHRNGIMAHNTSRVISELTCSVGGVQGSTANFSPQPETDCPAIADPLINRPPPPVGACTKKKFKIEIGVHILSPGVYCGGLKITKLAIAMMRPGIYVIKDGPLEVSGQGKLIGTEVGFFFTGKKSIFKFTKMSIIMIGAPKDGPLAGLLFFGDRTDKAGKKYIIQSNFAQKLLGTLYLPRGDLEIDAQKPIAAESAYTIVVARRIKLSSGPNLVLNSDYQSTDVPVPPGIGPVGGNVVLTE